MNEAVDVETLKCFLRLLRDVRTGQPYVEPAIYQCCTSSSTAAPLPRHRAKTSENYRWEVWLWWIQAPPRGVWIQSTKVYSSQKVLQWTEKIESSSSTKRLKVETSSDPDTYCLEDVEKTQEALEMSSGVIVFAKHEPGSVRLTFIVPVCTVESFTNINKSDEHLSDLAAIGITSIEIDGVINVKAHLEERVTALETWTSTSRHLSLEGDRSQGKAKQQLKREINNLETKKVRDKALLEGAWRQLCEAKSKWNDAQRRKDNAVGGTVAVAFGAVVLGVFFPPSLAVTIPAVAIGTISIKNASDAINSCRARISGHQRDIEEETSKIQEANKRISGIESEISDLTSKQATLHANRGHLRNEIVFLHC